MSVMFAACDDKDNPAATTAKATTVTSGEDDEDLDNSSEKPSKKPATTQYQPSMPSDPSELEELVSSLPDTNWGGEECYIIGRSDYAAPQFKNLEIWTEGTGNDPIDAAVWERNQFLHAKFNFRVRQHLTNTVKEEMAAVFDSGQDLYDICLYSPIDAAKHAEQGYLLDLSAIEYIDLDHPSWDQNITKQLSIGNKVYFTSSDFLLQDKDRTEIIYYNRNMARQANKGYLEDKVTSGDWTVEYFASLVKEFSKDGNGNQQLGDYSSDGSGDYIGLGLSSYDSFATFAFGAGVKLSYLDENGKLVINNDPTTTKDIIDLIGTFLFDKTQSLYVNDLTPVDYKAHCQLFGYGKQMFCADALSSLDRIHEGSTLREMIDFDYSFLPHPKYEAGMDTWYTSTPSSTTGSVIAIPTTVNDSAKSGFFVQALSEASTYSTLFTFYVQKATINGTLDLRAFEMLDIVFTSTRYDIASMYDMGKLFTMLSSFANLKSSNFKTLEQRYEAAKTAAESLMAKFA